MQINRRDFLKAISTFAVIPALPIKLADQINVPFVCNVTAHDTRPGREELTYRSYLSKSRLIMTPEIEGVKIYVKSNESNGVIKTCVAMANAKNQILDMSEVDFINHDMHLMTAGHYNFLVEFKKYAK